VTQNQAMKARTVQLTENSRGAGDTTRILLRGLIDYAGLFPPASLGMAGAVANYDSYSRSEFRWMLGRLIVPVARLEEFEEAAGRLPDSAGEIEPRWALSALMGANLSADLDRIREFNDRLAASRYTGSVSIGSIEVKISSAEEIDRLSTLIPPELETYFEIPWAAEAASSEMRDCIAAVAHCGRRAKIRTGGETPDKFPTPERVVEFTRLCAVSGIAFKATAGLHHPVRSLHRLTYQADCPSAIMHGFLNVFLAAAFVRAGMESPIAVELLNEQSPAAFHFDSEAVLWREHRLGLNGISMTRQDFAISFGSCSFTEPVDDLRALCLL
jgi:hypothetical protein